MAVYMTKSIRGIGFYGDIIILSILVSPFFISPDRLFKEIVPTLLCIVPAIFISVRLVKIGYKIQISTEDRFIRYKSWFSQTTYAFEDIDGYVTGIITRIGRGGSIEDRCIWLVKNSVMIRRIEEVYVGNFQFLLNDMESIPFLGSQHIDNAKQFKMFFKKLYIDQQGD